MMQCTVCKAGELKAATLEGLCPCLQCSNCQGYWVLISDYLDAKSLDLPIDEDLIKRFTESKKALLCPVSSTIMLKYRLSAQSEHKINLSPAANGFWLDKGLWELIKQQGLTKNLTQIFTEPGQRKIRAIIALNIFEDYYNEELGKEHHAKLKALREWLDNQPKKQEMLAYINAIDPYSALK